MSVYRPTGRGKVYWMDFVFAGQRVRETTRTRSKTLAKEAERQRRRALEAGAAGVRRARPVMFTAAAEQFVAARSVRWSPSSLRMHRTALTHLLPVFGAMLVCDIDAADVMRYQQRRLNEPVKPQPRKRPSSACETAAQLHPAARTVNMEIGTLRGVLKFAGRWSTIQNGVTISREDAAGKGRCLSEAEQDALVRACGQSNARSLLPFVVLALETGARYGTIRTLRWGQVDFDARAVQWGKDKTEAGTGRVVPLSSRAVAALTHWAGQFPGRKPEHFVFPHERVGGIGRSAPAGSRGAARFASGFSFGTDPSRPVAGIQHAWALAKKRAGVCCRFHDLRHTAASRMMAAGVPLPHIGRLLGWKPGTLALMAARYGHLGLEDLRAAVDSSSRPEGKTGAGSPNFPPNFSEGKPAPRPN